MDDLALLRHYVMESSDSAFAEIVGRHINLVYSSALRQLNDRHAAEDVTQTVFVVLSSKARRVCDRGRPLSAWLLTATRYAAQDARKISQRRTFHEREAARMAKASEPSSRKRDADEAEWEKLSPMLDDALGRLRETFRAAVALRFFENQTYGEVANRLGITEPAARQRVSRGIDQLRQILSRRGVVLPAVSLETMLLAYAVQTAPMHLSAGAMAIVTKGAALTARQFAIAKGTMLATTPLAAKAAGIALIVGTIVAAGAGIEKLTARPHAVVVPLVAAPVAALAAPGAVANQPIRGKAQTADGKPLARADVWLSRKSGRFPVVVAGRQTLPLSIGLHLKSDADGSFEFPAIDDAVSVIVLADEGTAILSVADVLQKGVVRVEPWATIAGTVTSKGKPVTDAVLTLERPTQGSMEATHRVGFQPVTVRTDSNGHYAFPNMMAGDINLSLSLKNSAPGKNDGELYLKVAAGEHLKADVPGGGPSVKGKIVLKQGLPTFSGALSNSPHRPGASIPFLVEQDGTFEVQGVPPGTYDLDVRSIDEGPANGRDHYAFELMALYMAKVVVPAATEDRTSAIDIGAIKPNVMATLNVGQVLPDFPFKMVDGGGEKRLSNFQGKYLLLHFVFPTGTSPFIDVHRMEALYKRIGDDPRLTVLEVAYENPAAFVKKYREENHVPWNLGVGKMAIIALADRFEDAPPPAPDVIPPAYIKGPYMLYLVDPQGKLLAKNLNENTALEAIDSALGARP